MIIFKCCKYFPPDPGITINNAPVPRVNKIIHLGHYLNEDIYRFDASKCIGDFNKQCNMFFADFKDANSNIRNVLFHKYCPAFYGIQILPLFDKCMNSVFIAWRRAIHRCWRVPWKTHNNILPHLAGVMNPEYFISRRVIHLIKSALSSQNVLVSTISKMATEGIHSIMGANKRLLENKIAMNEDSLLYK